MGCRGKEKRSNSEVGKHQSKTRCKHRTAHEPSNVCQCAQTFDNSFPYKDLPPPAPPDGRPDLWELQFCRWWGWNWVKKRDTLLRGESKNGESSDIAKRTSLNYKSRDNAVDEVPVKLPASSKSRKASISYKETDCKELCYQSALSPKEQFRTMCKCLLGKRKTPSEMAKLYNTPSTSMVGLKQQERISYGIGDRSAKLCRKPEVCRDRLKREKCMGRQSPVRKVSKDFTPQVPEQSATSASDSILSESLSSHRPEDSTEESVEYLTFKLARATNACPCQKTGLPTEQEKPEKDCQNNCKKTQTCYAFLDNYNVSAPMEENISEGLEKLVKVKGKKHKTICIMVCCCGTCNQNTPDNLEQNNSINENTPDSLEANDSTKCTKQTCTKQATSCSCQQCPKLCWNQINDSQKDGLQEKKLTSDKFTSFPLIIPHLNSKQLSKFGTPSKNYPWLQSAESTATTISLNNIGVNTKNFFDWLDIETKPQASARLSDFMDITDDFFFSPKLTTFIKKSDLENRVVLDAVCDAILQDHEDNSNQFLEKIELDRVKNSTCNTSRDYNDLSVLNVTSKADAYTELSKALNTEDVGTQLANRNDQTKELLENLDVKKLDNVMDNIMKSIFSESEENIKSTTHKDQYKKEPNKSKYMSPSKNQVFTKTGLLACQPFCSYMKSAKRAVANVDRVGETGKKKMKREENTMTDKDDHSCNNIGSIFSKIDDIVRKSKVKTAEIQKVLSLNPQKPKYESFNINHLESANNTLKKNYAMSSDNFKGSIINQAVTKHQNNPKYNMVNDLLTKLDFSGPSREVRIEEQSHPQPMTPLEVEDTVQKVETEIKSATECTNLLHEKLSKLSIQSFVVCDAKSSRVKLGKKQFKRNIGGKGSLIPIRK